MTYASVSRDLPEVVALRSGCGFVIDVCSSIRRSPLRPRRFARGKAAALGKFATTAEAHAYLERGGAVRPRSTSSVILLGPDLRPTIHPGSAGHDGVLRAAEDHPPRYGKRRRCRVAAVRDCDLMVPNRGHLSTGSRLRPRLYRNLALLPPKGSKHGAVL